MHDASHTVIKSKRVSFELLDTFTQQCEPLKDLSFIKMGSEKLSFLCMHSAAVIYVIVDLFILCSCFMYKEVGTE